MRRWCSVEPRRTARAVDAIDSSCRPRDVTPPGPCRRRRCAGGVGGSGGLRDDVVGSGAAPLAHSPGNCGSVYVPRPRRRCSVAHSTVYTNQRPPTSGGCSGRPGFPTPPPPPLSQRRVYYYIVRIYGAAAVYSPRGI